MPKINVQPLQTAPVFTEEKRKQLPGKSEEVSVDFGEIPELREVVLRDLPKSEPDWILVYACYKTSFGKESFSEQDIKDQYDKTERTSKSRLANLSNNIKSLLNKKYITVHNDTNYLIKPEGLEYAYKILEGNSTSKTSTMTGRKVPKESVALRKRQLKRALKATGSSHSFH